MKFSKIICIFFICLYSIVSFVYMVTLVYNFDNVRKGTSSTEYFPFYDKIVMLNTLVKTKLNKKFILKANGNIYDHYYKYNDGNIVHFSDIVNDNSLKLVEKIIDMNQYLNKNNINFIYVETPKKEYFYQDVLSNYGFEYSYKKESVIYPAFDNENINYVIGNSILENSNIERQDLFYKLDYHWNSKTSLFFAKQLINYLNDSYDYDFDTSNLEANNLHKLTYNNSFYGYYGRILGQSFKNYDDFVIYEPNKTSDYAVYYGKDKKTIYGNYLETLFDIKKIKNGGNNEYQAYVHQIGGLQPIIKIKNNDLNQDKKIMFISDSMFYGLAPYLSLSIGNIEAIDIRKDNGNFNGNLKEYIESSKPDCIIYITDTMYDEDLDKLNF